MRRTITFLSQAESELNFNEVCSFASRDNFRRWIKLEKNIVQMWHLEINVERLNLKSHCDVAAAAGYFVNFGAAHRHDRTGEFFGKLLPASKRDVFGLDQLSRNLDDYDSGYNKNC